MVGSRGDKYEKYFAKSPGQSDSPRTISTDKTKGKSRSVSESIGTANASVDPSGIIKAASSVKSSPEPELDTPKKQRDLQATPEPSKCSAAGDCSRGSDSSSQTSADSMTSRSSDSRDATPESYSSAQIQLDKKKKEIVSKIMADVFNPLFDRWLEQRFGVRSRTGDQDGGTAGNPDHSSSGGRDTKKPPRGEKRGYNRDDQEDGTQGGGIGSGGGGGGSKRPRRDTGTEDKLRFACPFFKHNPTKYKTIRTCCGPGWTNVHRLKEHVYRKHALPEFICNRCCEVFEDDNGLKDHQRSETPCRLTKESQRDGFDKSQEKLLRSRTNPATEQHKWEEMYKILFPDEPVPSPYYDDSSGAGSKATGKQVASKELAAYEQYLRRELPPVVRRDLEREVEKQLNCVEDQMKIKAVEIFRDVQLKLFRTWSFQGGWPERDPSPEAQGDTGEKPGAASEEAPLAEVLDPYVLDDPDFAAMFTPDGFGLGDFLSMHPPKSDEYGVTEVSDSAYGSMSQVYSFNGTEGTLPGYGELQG